MAKQMRQGLSKNDVADVIAAAFGNIKEEAKDTAVLKVETDGFKQATKEVQDLEAALKNFNRFNQQQKNAVNLFGGQEKVINNLKKSWNEYVTAVKNGILKPDGSTTVSSSDNKKEYEKQNAYRSNLMKSANAVKSMFGEEKISEISTEIQEAVDNLLKTASFSDFNLKPEVLSPVLDWLRDVTDKAQKAGISLKQALESIGINDFKINIDGDPVNELLSLSQTIQDAGQSIESNFQMSDSWDTNNIRYLIEVLKQLLGEIKNISTAFGQIDDTSGVPNLVTQMNNLSTAINNISEAIGVLGQDGNNTVSILNRLSKMYRRIGQNKLNINLREDTSLDVTQKIKAEEDFWRRQAERYVKAYDQIMEIGRYTAEQGGMYTGDEQDVFTRMYSQRPVQIDMYGRDFWKDWSRQTVINDAKDPIQRIQSIMDFLNLAKKAAEYSHDNIPENRDAFLENIYQYFNGGFKMDGHNLKAPGLDMKYLNSEMRKLFEFTAGRKDKKSLKEEAFDFLGSILNQSAENGEMGVGTDVKGYSESVSELTKVIGELSTALSGLDFSALKDESAVKTINGLTTSLDGMRTTIETGLGIQTLEDGTTTTFLSDIQTAIDNITTSIKNLSSAIENVDFSKMQVSQQGLQNILVYRGTNGDDPFTSNASGATFWHSTKSEARRYGTPGENKTLYSGLLSMGNPLEIDANGANYHDINYLGTGADEASKRIIELTQHAEECRQELLQLQNASSDDAEAMQRAAQVGLDYSETLKQIKAISDDETNPYGKHNTDWFAEYAQKHGYDGLHVKNVIDNPDALTEGGTPGDVYVTFGRQQVQNIQLLEQANHALAQSYRDVNSAAQESQQSQQVQPLNTQAVEQEGQVVAQTVEAENSSLSTLQGKVENVTTAVDRKTDAFRREAEVVDGAVTGEANILDALLGTIDIITEHIEKLNEKLNEFGQGGGFGDFIKDINGSADALNNFATILNKSERQRKEALKDAKKAPEQEEQKPEDATVQPEVEKETIDETNEATEAKKQEAEATRQLTDAEKELIDTKKNIPPSSEADNSAEADKRAADAARDRAAANKELLESEQELDAGGGENGNENISRDGIYLNQRNMVGDDRWGYVEELGYGQRRSVNFSRDEDGNVIPTESTFTDFRKLENEIIKVDQAIITLWNDYQRGVENGNPVEGIQEQLDILGERSRRLTVELDRYYKENNYMTDSQQVMDFNRRRQEESRLTTAKLQQRNDQQDYNEENRIATRQAREEAQELLRIEREYQKERQRLIREGQRQAQQEEEAENRRLVQQAYEQARQRQQEEENYQRERARLLAEGQRQAQQVQREYEQEQAQEARDRQSQVEQGQRFIKEQENYEQEQIQTQHLREQREAYTELTNTVQRYVEIRNRIAQNRALDGDAEEVERLDARIIQLTDDLEHSPLFSQDMETKALSGLDTLGNRVNDSFNKQVRDITNQYDTLQRRINDFAANRDQKYFGEHFDGEVANLRSQMEKLRSIDLVDQDDINRAQELLRTINETLKTAQSNRENIAATEQQRSKLAANISSYRVRNTALNADEKAQLQQYIGNLNNSGLSMTQAQVDQIAVGFNKIKTQAQEAGRVGKTFGDTLMGSFKNLSRYLLSFASFYRIIGVLRGAVATVKELDSALMEVRKVSSETVENLKEWQNITFDQADTVGGSAKQIQESTATWLRLGKSFTEAQEAAQASVKLLNVSEFTNIDDATTALVSMRQAFSDLTYEDFIDKLNGVGDNFSSSTDQLAQGMKNVSSVLKVAGNDIDQSLALLTAANDITQDMSKASMGVRTVALRISGTQEAKQELEDLGEDVSDFVVQTQSKVDAQVRKYTQTAKNPNGISVLDKNGRLRSTYDVLRDISEVYDEIVKKDNEFGTNTSNALLELLAGKTRSNILASILQNPEVLQDAYEQSKNSQGVGQRELDIYLDSVEAKLAKLQNRLQELASITIDSDWLKAIIDLGTEAVKIINTLGKSLGGLNTVAGTIGGIFLQRKGFGVANMLQRMPLAIQEAKQQIQYLGMGNEVQTFMRNRDLTQQIMNTSLGVNETTPAIIQETTDKLLEAKGATATWGDVAKELPVAANGIGSAFGIASKAIGSFGLSILSTLGTIGLIIAGLKILEAGIGAIYNYIRADEIAIEKGKEAKKEIEDLNTAYQDQSDYITKNAQEYEKLSEGIGENNKNISLSEEEYSKFLEMNNKLADMFPQLVTGFDDQGNAIIKLGDGATTASEQLALLLEQERQIANFKIGENLGDVINGTITRIGQLNEEIQGYQEDIDAYGSMDALGVSQSGSREDILKAFGIQTNASGQMIGFEHFYDKTREDARETATVMTNAYRETMESLGLTLSDLESDVDVKMDEETGKWLSRMSYHLSDGPVELTEEFMDALYAALEEADPSNKVKELMTLQSADEKEIRATWNSAVGSIVKSLSVYDGYDELGDDVTQAISNAITNMDLSVFDTDEAFKEAFAKYKSGDDTAIRAYFRKLFLDPFTDMEPDVKTAFDEISKLYENETITFADRQAKVRNILSTSGRGGELLDLMGIMGWNAPEEDLNIDKYNQILEKSGFSKTELNSILTEGNFETAYDLVINDKKAFKTIDDFLAAIQKAQAEAKKIESDTFSSLFKDASDEGLQKTTDAFQETIENVKKYREEIAAGDFKDATDMTQTFNENMKAGENYTDYLNRVQLKALQDFADKYKEIVSGITDPKEKEDAQRFLVDLLSGIDWDGFDVQNIKQRVFGQLYEIFGSDIGPEFRNMLEKSLVGDGDWEMFSTLLSSGMSPQEALDEVIGPDGLSARVQLQLDKQSLQDEIDRLTSERSTNEARKSMLEAQGFSIDKDYYIEDDEISNQLIRHYEEQIKIAEEEIANSDDKDFINTQQEKINELQRNIFSERATKASNRAAIRELALKPFEDARKEIESQMGTLDSTKALGEANGQTDFSMLNQRMIDLLNSDNEQIDAEIQQLRHQQSELSIRAKWTNKELSDMDGYQELVDKEKDLLDQRAKNNQQRIELQKEIDNAPLVNLQNIGTALSRDTADAEKAISQAEEYGGEVSRAMYQSAIDAAQAEGNNLEKQRAEIAGRIAKIEEEYELAGKAPEELLQNSNYQDLISQLDDVDSSAEDIRQKIIGWADAINNFDANKVAKQLEAINSSISADEAEIQAKRARGQEVTSDDYNGIIMNRQAAIRLAQADVDRAAMDVQNAELSGASSSRMAELDKAYAEARAVLFQAEADLYSSMEEQNQEAMNNMDAYINNQQAIISNTKAHIALLEAQGKTGSGIDYQTMIDTQGRIISKYKDEVKTARNDWNSKKGTDLEDDAWTTYLETQTKQYEAEQALIDLQVEQAESRVKDQENEIRDAKLEQTNLQNLINEQVAERGEADASLYNSLANSYTAEAEQQRALAKYWSDLAKSEKNTELAAQFLEKSNTAFSDALSAEESAREQRTMPIQNELKELQNQMQDIQAEATRMEEAITKAETNHQKVGANMYKNLIKNGKDQIKNLVMQRVRQRELLKTVDEGSEKWYEYQSNIDSLSSEISAMQNNIVGWSETMTSLVSTNAEALSSALSSAFSEMDSGTGMTIDTMNELKKQFSDLKGFNMDNVFYETADGVKMNKSAVEELVDQEYMLQQAILEEALAQENLSAADRVRYEQQLSMLQAIYDQQKANFTGYAEWQTAQSTDNAGKRYEDIQGALKSVQEMYSNGLTGTDDFRSFVSMIDQWGLDTVDAYDRNIEMVKRYVTEDSSGLTNFYSDMVSKGFGTGSASEGFSLNVPNVEEAARAMGMSAEFMNILLSRAEDYGATNNWVESELDGNLKIQDATQKLIEAKTRLAELERSGADTTAIEDAANVVQFYEQQVQDYVSNTGSVIAREGQITSAQLRSYQAQMQAIVDEMNDTELTQGMTDQQKQAWQNGHLESLKNLAVEAGVEVDWENIDLQESFKQAYPGYLEAPVTPKLSDVDLSAISDNEEVQSVIQGLGDTTKWTDANTELQGYIDSINEFPYEELKTIDMNDGKWDKGYESAEKSLEGIAKMFGLSRKQADQLVEALHEMGAIGQETETYDKNAITTNMSNLADKGYTSDQVMSMTEEERKKVYVDTVVDDTSYEEWKKDVESTTVQAKVQTALDSGKSAQDMLNMSDTALAQTIGIELDTENFDEQIAAARESLQEAATLTVKIDETQFSQLTGAEDVKIGADTSEVTTAIEEAETSVESSNPKMKVGATVGEALSSASHVRDTISSMNPQMTVGIKTDTSGLVSSISNALSNKIFTIKTTQVNVGKKYTGTMLSPAKASGTAYNAPLRMIPAQKAFAQGDVGLKEDEEALVNELGTESLIRDGQWFLIPGGMHVESLKKDDIVLNHLQTADLLKHGKAFGHGKAYAEGSGVPLSSIPLAPAHADRGKTRQNATSSTWNAKQPYTNKTPKDNTTAIKDNTKQLKKNNDTQKKGTSAIDAFKKWLDGWVDWIDNRIDDLNTRIDRLTNQAENLVGYQKKNKNIQSAMNLIADLKTFQNAKLVTGTTKGPDGVTAQYAKKATGGKKGTLLYDTMRGAVRYQQQADKVMNKAVTSGILSKKKAAEITKLIQTGKIDITQYNENIRQVISSYEDW